MMKMGGSNWVDRENFFNREAEPNGLMERVREGTHTLLSAQRRMGKTSLIRELQRRLADSGDFEVAFVDLEATNDHPTQLLESGSVAGLSTDRKVHAGAKKSVRHKAGHDT